MFFFILWRPDTGAPKIRPSFLSFKASSTENVEPTKIKPSRTYICSSCSEVHVMEDSDDNMEQLKGHIKLLEEKVATVEGQIAEELKEKGKHRDAATLKLLYADKTKLLDILGDRQKEFSDFLSKRKLLSIITTSIF